MVTTRSRLPNMKSLWYGGFPKVSEEVRDFLEYCIPTQLDSLSINHKYGFMSNGSFYFRDLPEQSGPGPKRQSFAKTLSGVKKEIFLQSLYLSDPTLEKIFKSSFNVERLILSTCNFDLQRDLDFSGPKYNITYLSLTGCEWDEDNAWNEHPERFVRILKAIKGSSLADSLKSLEMKYCDLHIDDAKQMMLDNGLSHITVTQKEMMMMGGEEEEHVPLPQPEYEAELKKMRDDPKFVPYEPEKEKEFDIYADSPENQ